MPPISIAAYAGDLVLGLGLDLDLDLDLGKRNLSSLLPSASAAQPSAAVTATSASASASARPSKRDCCYSSRSVAALAPANYCAAFPADASLWTRPTITTTTTPPAIATHVTNPPSYSRSNSALPSSYSPLARKARGSSPSATIDAVAGSTSATRHGGLGKHPRSSPSPSMSTHHDGFNPHTAADLLRQAMLSR